MFYNSTFLIIQYELMCVSSYCIMVGTTASIEFLLLHKQHKLPCFLSLCMCVPFVCFTIDLWAEQAHNKYRIELVLLLLLLFHFILIL
jgi:hypothetical protein